MLDAGLTKPHAGVITTKPVKAPVQKPLSDSFLRREAIASKSTQVAPHVQAHTFETTTAFTAREFIASSLPPSF